MTAFSRAILGFAYTHRTVELAVLDVIVTFLEDRWTDDNIPDIRKVVALSAFLEGLSSISGIPKRRITNRIGPLKVLLCSTPAYLLGLVMLSISGFDQIPGGKNDVYFVTAVLLISVGKSGASRNLKELLHSEPGTQKHNPAQPYRAQHDKEADPGGHIDNRQNEETRMEGLQMQYPTSQHRLADPIDPPIDNQHQRSSWTSAPSLVEGIPAINPWGWGWLPGFPTQISKVPHHCGCPPCPFTDGCQLPSCGCPSHKCCPSPKCCRPREDSGCPDSCSSSDGCRSPNCRTPTPPTTPPTTTPPTTPPSTPPTTPPSTPPSSPRGSRYPRRVNPKLVRRWNMSQSVCTVVTPLALIFSKVDLNHTVAISTSMMGIGFLVFLLCIPPSQRSVGQAAIVQTFHSIPGVNINYNRPNEARSPAEQRKPLFIMILTWTTFLVFGLVLSTGSTLFIDEGSKMNPKHFVYFLLLMKNTISPVSSDITERLVNYSKDKKLKMLTIRTGIMTAMGLSVFCCITASRVAVRWLHTIGKCGLCVNENDDKAVLPMSILWLAPQFCLLALMDGIGKKGLDLFFKVQVSDKTMKEYGSEELNEAMIGLGSFINALLVFYLRNWFCNTLSNSCLGKYYEMLMVLSFVNLFYYWLVSTFYKA